MIGIYLQISLPLKLEQALASRIISEGAKKTKNTVFPFEYNDINKFTKFVKKII